MITPSLLALVALLPQGPTATSVKTEHFEIRCHWQSKRAAEEVKQVVEQVSVIAAQIYDLSDLKLEKLLQVNLYPTQQAYEVVDANLTGGAFARNGAFSDHESRSAHIAFAPVVSEAVLNRSGLPMLVRRLVAHEAAHVLRFALFNNYRSHPRWFVDGAASWIDQKVMEALGLSSGLESDPYVSSGIVRLQTLIKNKDLPSIDDLLVGKVYDLNFNERYDISQLFFNFLIDGIHKDKLAELIRDPLLRFGGGRDFDVRLKKAFKTILGKVSLRKLDKQFKQYVLSLHPKWSEVIRSLETNEDVWRQIAFADVNAVAWRTEGIKAKEYEITGAFEILEGGRHQANMLLDRDDKGFISIAFSPGSLTIFHYHSRSEEWERLLSRKVEGLGINMSYDFRIAVAGKRLQVFLRGEELAELSISGRKMRGPWGVGMQAGGTGLWHKLKGPGLE